MEEVVVERHQGIQIHKIPAEGVGGLIFALGFSALFLLAVPSFVPVVAACVLGGIAAALVRTQLAPAPGTQVSSAGPLFLAGLGAALLVSSASGFSALFATCATGGVAAAYLLNRASLSRRLVSIKP